MFSKVVFVVERLAAAVTLVKLISVGYRMVQLHANLVELFVAVVALAWFLTSVGFTWRSLPFMLVLMCPS